MTDVTTQPIILSKALFEKYAADWAGLVSGGDSAALTKAFVNVHSKRIAYAAVPVDSIIGLLSAVGVQQIKVRFLLVPGSTEVAQHFSIALFAANSQGERVSAYYLVDKSWLADTAAAILGERVPQGLANLWLENWDSTKEPKVTSAMFTVPAGQLLGYNFEVKEFMTPLFKLQPFKKPAQDANDKDEIRLYFGLHEYLGPDSDGTDPTKTFGLVVRPSRPKPAAEVEEDSYDMATPCPPGG
jgi:hypothetical protein